MRNTGISRAIIGVLAAILSLAAAGCCAPRRLDATIPLPALHAQDASQSFAKMFCAVLKAEPMTGAQGGTCSKYLRSPVMPDGQPLPVEIKAYRLLLVGGYGSQCITGETATFSDSVKHLETVHGATVDVVNVSAFGSSEYNGKTIFDFVTANFTKDTVSPPRPYIAVGYSKGAPDLLQAFADHPELTQKIAALITLAGVVEGSRLAGSSDKVIDQLFISQLHLTNCDDGDSGGLASLEPAIRQAFLQKHPDLFVPTYSVVASSTERGTSRILLPTWCTLCKFGKTEDSQMIDAEAVVPKAQYLGMVRGDHWAIAIPFELDPSKKDLIDHNHFPRFELFESMFRYVASDLQNRQPK